MFERLMARLHRDTPPKEPLATPDARMALGILLVRLAMVDRAYLFEEVEEIETDPDVREQLEQLQRNQNP